MGVARLSNLVIAAETGIIALVAASSLPWLYATRAGGYRELLIPTSFVIGVALWVVYVLARGDKAAERHREALWALVWFVTTMYASFAAIAGVIETEIPFFGGLWVVALTLAMIDLHAGNKIALLAGSLLTLALSVSALRESLFQNFVGAWICGAFIVVSAVTLGASMAYFRQARRWPLTRRENIIVWVTITCTIIVFLIAAVIWTSRL